MTNQRVTPFHAFPSGSRFARIPLSPFRFAHRSIVGPEGPHPARKCKKKSLSEGFLNIGIAGWDKRVTPFHAFPSGSRFARIPLSPFRFAHRSIVGPEGPHPARKCKKKSLSEGFLNIGIAGWDKRVTPFHAFPSGSRFARIPLSPFRFAHRSIVGPVGPHPARKCKKNPSWRDF